MEKGVRELGKMEGGKKKGIRKYLDKAEVERRDKGRYKREREG